MSESKPLGTCDRIWQHVGDRPHRKTWACQNWRESPASQASSTSEKCGQPAASFIPRWGMSFACVLPKGHEGEHKQGGNCFKHGEYIGSQCPQRPRCGESGAVSAGGMSAELLEAQIGTAIVKEFGVSADHSELVERFCDLRDALKDARVEVAQLREELSQAKQEIKQCEELLSKPDKYWLHQYRAAVDANNVLRRDAEKAEAERDRLKAQLERCEITGYYQPSPEPPGT